MNIPIRTSAGVGSLPADVQLLTWREIHLNGEITSEKAEEIFQVIRLLDKEDTEQPIDLYIHSPGGEVNAGLLICDAIKAARSPVRTFCCGYAYSIAALLVTVCGKNGRYIYPNSVMMLHEPYLNGSLKSGREDLDRMCARLKADNERLADMLVKHTGQTPETIRAEISYDHYFTAEEAVSFGLVDSIVGEDA